MLLSIWAAVCMVMHTCILESSLGSLDCPLSFLLGIYPVPLKRRQ